MNITELKIKGCYLIESVPFQDKRGHFIKTYHEENFNHAGLTLSTAAEFHTVSKKDVIRGMYFQVYPASQDKLVYCDMGEVLNVLLDLR